jgi:hypothetical protein
MNFKLFGSKPILAVFVALMSIITLKPIVIKNNTKKSFFVISTYKFSNIRIGYEIRPESEACIDKIYIGTISKDEYAYPDTLFFYDNSRDVVCSRIYGEYSTTKMENYRYRIPVDDIGMPVMKIFSMGELIIFTSCKA